MLPFEFIIPHRPRSHQAGSKRAWQELVKEYASQGWTGSPVTQTDLKFTLVYLRDSQHQAPDINNLIKPIQDSLIGLVYQDGSLIIDVDGHMRFLDGVIASIHLPSLLEEAVIRGNECVYVRIDSSQDLAAQL